MRASLAIPVALALAMGACNAVFGIEQLADDPAPRDAGPDATTRVAGGRDATAQGAEVDSSLGASSDDSDNGDGAAFIGSNSDDGGGPPCDGALLCDAGLVCTPTALGCNGAQPQICDSSGSHWTPVGNPCYGADPYCLVGECVPCKPDSVQCAGQQPQVCDATGHWANSASACVNKTCLVTRDDAGTAIPACSGDCAPGQTSGCSNNGPVPCGVDGKWSTPSACVDSTCVNAFDADAGVTVASCQGVCVVGVTQCGVNSSCPGYSSPYSTAIGLQTCNGQGQWGTAVCCGGSCDGGNPVCSQGACGCH
jgi:hypothetical protein